MSVAEMTLRVSGKGQQCNVGMVMSHQDLNSRVCVVFIHSFDNS